MIPADELKYLKAEIQSLGVKFSGGSLKRGGAGPAEGDTIVLNGEMIATIPAGSRFVKDSPFDIAGEEKHLFLRKTGRNICDVQFLPRPEYYSRFSHDGTPCWKIALRHGRDCLATTVVQRCVYWGTSSQCMFCGIELSLNSGLTIEIKTPQQLSETAKFAYRLDNLTHITLTTGTQTSKDRGIDHLCECVKSIKDTTPVAVHVQIEPVDTIENIDRLKESGADTIGIHIESYDMEILRRVSPVKASHGIKKYTDYWKHAVDIFGLNQVSSFLIAGLGEDPSSIIDGSGFLSELGVYPFIIPLRPIPGSKLENERPPAPGIMIDIYEKAAEIIKRAGLTSKKNLAGCVRCGACSAVTDFEN